MPDCGKPRAIQRGPPILELAERRREDSSEYMMGEYTNSEDRIEKKATLFFSPLYLMKEAALLSTSIPLTIIGKSAETTGIIVDAITEPFRTVVPIGFTIHFVKESFAGNLTGMDGCTIPTRTSGSQWKIMLTKEGSNKDITAFLKMRGVEDIQGVQAALYDMCHEQVLAAALQRLQDIRVKRPSILQGFVTDTKMETQIDNGYRRGYQNGYQNAYQNGDYPLSALSSNSDGFLESPTNSQEVQKALFPSAGDGSTGGELERKTAEYLLKRTRPVEYLMGRKQEPDVESLTGSLQKLAHGVLQFHLRSSGAGFKASIALGRLFVVDPALEVVETAGNVYSKIVNGIYTKILKRAAPSLCNLSALGYDFLRELWGLMQKSISSAKNMSKKMVSAVKMQIKMTRYVMRSWWYMFDTVILVPFVRTPLRFMYTSMKTFILEKMGIITYESGSRKNSFSTPRTKARPSSRILSAKKSTRSLLSLHSTRASSSSSNGDCVEYQSGYYRNEYTNGYEQNGCHFNASDDDSDTDYDKEDGTSFRSVFTSVALSPIKGLNRAAQATLSGAAFILDSGMTAVDRIIPPMDVFPAGTHVTIKYDPGYNRHKNDGGNGKNMKWQITVSYDDEEGDKKSNDAFIKKTNNAFTTRTTNNPRHDSTAGTIYLHDDHEPCSPGLPAPLPMNSPKRDASALFTDYRYKYSKGTHRLESHLVLIEEFQEICTREGIENILLRFKR